MRYRLLETIRDCVLEATPPEEIDAANAGLFAWAEGFARVARDEFEGEAQGVWFDRADEERENLRLAVVYGTDLPGLRERALRLAADLDRFLVARGHYAFGRALVEPVLAASPGAPAPLRAKATNLVGVLAMCRGDLDAATTRFHEGRELARAVGDLSAEGSTLSNLGMIAWERQDAEGACRWYEQAIGALTAAGDKGRLGATLLNLGSALIDLERFDEARAALQGALPLLRERGDLSRVAFVIGNLGYLAIVRGDWEEGRARVVEGLGAFERADERKGQMNLLVDAAAILLHDGDLEAVATIRGAIERMGRIALATPTPRDVPRLGAIDAAVARGLDPAVAQRLRLKGLGMTPQNGVEYAMEALRGVSIAGNLGKIP